MPGNDYYYKPHIQLRELYPVRLRHKDSQENWILVLREGSSHVETISRKLKYTRYFFHKEQYILLPIKIKKHNKSRFFTCFIEVSTKTFISLSAILFSCCSPRCEQLRFSSQPQYSLCIASLFVSSLFRCCLAMIRL